MIERLYREIRRRTRVVGNFPDSQSTLMLITVRIRYVTSNPWSTRRYLDMFRPARHREHSELTTMSQTGKTPSVQETGHSPPYLDAITNDFHITTSMKEHYL